MPSIDPALLEIPTEVSRHLMNLERLRLVEHRDNGDYRISASGDLIISNADRLQSRIDQAIKAGSTFIILDLSGVAYIDSFGIGVVIKTKSEIDKKRGRLRVIVSPTIHTLFEKCHLDDYIDLELKPIEGEEAAEEQ